MARLSGSLPRKADGFISPFSLPWCICWLWASPILFQAQEREDAQGLDGPRGCWEVLFYLSGLGGLPSAFRLIGTP